MALICAQCGTDNPAGNAFCMSCGSPLAAVPASPGAMPPAAGVPVVDPDATQTFVLPETPTAPPPIGAPQAPASFLPPGYVPGASPYLPAPPTGTPPAHRTSSTMIIAIVVAVLIVVCGGGVVYAAVHKGGTTPTVATNPPANVPTNPPTSAPTAAPTQPPASTPSAPTGVTGGQIVTTPFAKVFVPAGYTVSDQENDYIVLTPNSSDLDGVGLQSEPLGAPTTNAQLDQALLANDQQSVDPSAKMCTTKAPATTQVIGSGGPIAADVIDICESVTPDNGPAFSAVDAYIDGVAKASDGSLKAVWFEILGPATGFSAFANSIPGSLFSQSIFTDASPIS